MTTITLGDFAHYAPDLYRAKRDDGRAVACLLEGPPGIAKTAIVNGPLRQALARAFNCKVAVVADILSQRDSVDLRGHLIPYKQADGTPAAAYTKADLMVRCEAALNHVGKDGIVVLFLDEFTGSDHLMQKAAAELLDKGKIGTNQLPNNVWVIAAGNRMEDGAGVNRMLTHVTNRMRKFSVYLPIDTGADPKARRQGWLPDYAEPNDLPLVIRAFAKACPEAFAAEVPRDGLPYQTFRSLTDVAWFIKHSRPEWVERGIYVDQQDHFAMATIEASIGEKARTMLYGYTTIANELPTKDEVLRDPTRARMPPAHRVDAQYAMQAMLLDWTTPDNIDVIFQYATRMNREFQALMVKQLHDKAFGGVFINCPTFTRWYSDPENKALLATLKKV